MNSSCADFAVRIWDSTSRHICDLSNLLAVLVSPKRCFLIFIKSPRRRMPPNITIESNHFINSHNQSSTKGNFSQPQTVCCCFSTTQWPGLVSFVIQNQIDEANLPTPLPIPNLGEVEREAGAFSVQCKSCSCVFDSANSNFPSCSQLGETSRRVRPVGNPPSFFFFF